jgi:hypothetical protein
MTRYEKLRWMCVEEMAQWLAEIEKLPRMECRQWLQSKGRHGTKYNDILFSVESAAEALYGFGDCGTFCGNDGAVGLGCDAYTNPSSCKERVVEWLKEEAEA